MSLANGGIRYSAANITGDDWLSIERFVILINNSVKVEEVQEGVHDYSHTEDSQYIERIENYASGWGWSDVGNANEITEASIRFYDRNDNFSDYSLGQEEIKSFRTILRIDQLHTEIIDILHDWLRAIDSIDDVPQLQQESAPALPQMVSAINPDIAVILNNGCKSYPLSFQMKTTDTMFLSIPDALFSEKDTVKELIGSHYILTGTFLRRTKMGNCEVETKYGIVSIDPPSLVDEVVDDSYPEEGETANFYVTYCYTWNGMPFFELGFSEK